MRGGGGLQSLCHGSPIKEIVRLVVDKVLLAVASFFVCFVGGLCVQVVVCMTTAGPT